MSDFLFHEVSEKEREQIKKQAKQIMDDFSSKLSKIGKVKEPLIERDLCMRDESEGTQCDFSREIMFENAPNTLYPKGHEKGTSKNKDFIIAEKKKW
ncbi:hypothetical protein ACFL0X_01775 [Nanoarchaeota archaeon]